MDRILTAEAGLLDSEFDSKSSTDDAFLDCLPGESFIRQRDENGDQFHRASETDSGRAIIHRMHSDDISRELPANILDTDSYDKSEDGTIVESRPQLFSISSTTDFAIAEFNSATNHTKCCEDAVRLDVSTNAAAEISFVEPTSCDANPKKCETITADRNVGSELAEEGSSSVGHAFEPCSSSVVELDNAADSNNSLTSEVPVELNDLKSIDSSETGESNSDLVDSSNYASKSSEVNLEDESEKTNTLNLTETDPFSKIYDAAESNEILDLKDNVSAESSGIQDSLTVSTPLTESTNVAENERELTGEMEDHSTSSDDVAASTEDGLVDGAIDMKNNLMRSQSADPTESRVLPTQQSAGDLSMSNGTMELEENDLPGSGCIQNSVNIITPSHKSSLSAAADLAAFDGIAERDDSACPSNTQDLVNDTAAFKKSALLMSDDSAVCSKTADVLEDDSVDPSNIHDSVVDDTALSDESPLLMTGDLAVPSGITNLQEDLAGPSNIQDSVEDTASSDESPLSMTGDRVGSSEIADLQRDDSTDPSNMEDSVDDTAPSDKSPVSMTGDQVGSSGIADLQRGDSTDSSNIQDLVDDTPLPDESLPLIENDVASLDEAVGLETIALGELKSSDISESIEHCAAPSNEISNTAECDSVESNVEQSATFSWSRMESVDSAAEVSDANRERNEGFVPTIVGIRGACTETATTATNSASKEEGSSLIDSAIDVGSRDSLASELASSDIRDTQSNTRRDDSENDKTATVSDSVILDTADEDNSSRVNGHDLIHIDERHANSCFTSELDIEEERTTPGKDGRPEVYCIEPFSKIPSPIPIKMEPNVETVEKPNSDVTPASARKRTGAVDLARKSCSLPSVSAHRDFLYRVRERGRGKNDTVRYTTVGYSCHLCNTVFQEHERLNEHMILHRNNSLIESSRLKKINRRMKPYSCTVCNKHLSTPKSLQMHLLLHSNEKPHRCPVCRKDFRHPQAFRQHVLKHSVVGRTDSEPLAESAVRDVDFGKLVGPLFVKETFLNVKSKEPDKKAVPSLEPKTFEKEAPGPRPAYAVKHTARLSFDRPLFRRKDNTKENQAYLVNPVVEKSRVEPMAATARTKTAGDEPDDDIIPLKTFNNVENIVMNATRYIVKLDNLDPNILKRKIKTPDISIDRGSLAAAGSKHVGQKRRVVLSPPDPAKRLKLDQIENIIMDDVAFSVPGEHEDSDSGGGHNFVADSDVDAGGGTLTHNELLRVLDDSPASRDTEKPKPSYVSELRRTAQLLTKSEAQTAKSLKFDGVRGSGGRSTQLISRPSTGVTQSAGSPFRPCFRDLKSTPRPGLGELLTAKRAAPARSPESTHSPAAKRSKLGTPLPSSAAAVPLVDLTSSPDHAEAAGDAPNAFDSAFQKVAQRRLLLISNRAALNEGKVENKYLLGPLFWRKALRRARLDAFDVAVEAKPSAAATPTSGGRLKYGRLDERRTNDPAKLQARAESKLAALLRRVRKLDDVSQVNLTGPLFWRRTLKLAGVHGPEDLPGLLADDRPSLRDVRFVEEKLPSARSHDDASSVADFLQPLPETAVPATEDAESRQTLVDSILHDPAALTTKALSSGRTAGEPIAKAESILYDSLTRPQSRDQPAARIHASASCQAGKTDVVADQEVILIDSDNEADLESDRTKASPEVVVDAADDNGKTVNAESKKCDSKLSTRLTERYKMDVSRGSVDEATENPTEEGDSATANLILNVDGNLQLIGAGDVVAGKEPGMQDGANYVLVSDETGAMQLVKERDLRLMEAGALETEGAGGAPQYVVNVQGENYGNLELVGEPSGSEQVTYALQFDGENYTAVQFVRNETEETKKEADKMTFVPEAVTDLNHIGKELSDFLNLDYGTLLKNDAADQAQT